MGESVVTGRSRRFRFVQLLSRALLRSLAPDAKLLAGEPAHGAARAATAFSSLIASAGSSRRSRSRSL